MADMRMVSQALYTDSSGASARRASPIASGVNLAAQRPSVSAATAGGRCAQSPKPGNDRAGRSLSRARCRRQIPVPAAPCRCRDRPLADGRLAHGVAGKLRALPARYAGGQFRRPLSVRASAARTDTHARATGAGGVRAVGRARFAAALAGLRARRHQIHNAPPAVCHGTWPIVRAARKASAFPTIVPARPPRDAMPAPECVVLHTPGSDRKMVNIGSQKTLPRDGV